jgi:hypothetical protein
MMALLPVVAAPMSTIHDGGDLIDRVASNCCDCCVTYWPLLKNSGRAAPNSVENLGFVAHKSSPRQRRFRGSVPGARHLAACACAAVLIPVGWP